VQEVDYAERVDRQGLKVGSILTIVGMASLDADGTLSMSAAGGLAYMTTLPLNTLLQKTLSSANWSHAAAVGFGALAALCIAYSVGRRGWARITGKDRKNSRRDSPN
jgi:hypothetical protein